jgi:hypothetical protein
VLVEHPCPRTIDEPIRVLGLDGEDWMLVGTVGMIVYVLATAFAGLAAGMLTVFGVRLAKRGQPPGALRHAFWLLGFPLPGWPLAPPSEGRRYSPW